MDDWDLSPEETGEFDHPGGEGTSPSDAGWKDELNLAEFPIAGPDGSHPRRPDDAGLRGPAGTPRQPADRSTAHDHGDAQAWLADSDLTTRSWWG